MTRRVLVWLSTHRLVVGLVMLALAASYFVLVYVAGGEIATVVGVGYTILVVTGSFIVNLAKWATHK